MSTVTAGGLWRALVPVLTQADCAIVNKWLGWPPSPGGSLILSQPDIREVRISLLDASFHLGFQSKGKGSKYKRSQECTILHLSCSGLSNNSSNRFENELNSMSVILW